MENYSEQLKELFANAVTKYLNLMQEQNIKELNIYDLMGEESDVIFKDAEGNAQYGKIMRYTCETSIHNITYHCLDVSLDNSEQVIVNLGVGTPHQLDVASVLSMIDCVTQTDILELMDYSEVLDVA